MFLSLCIIFIFGVFGGILFDKIKIPKLIWYIILGILIGPSLLNIVDESLIQISSILRQIALVIILTRSGLSLDLKTLKEIGRPAILMCFIPALFEIIGVALFAPLFLGITLTEALLLGSVLAAVSPAVVVPRMLDYIKSGHGKEHHTPELIMAGASCDDIFVIILFYSFKNMVKSEINFSLFLEIPLSIFLGILLGINLGFILVFVFKKIKLQVTIKTILTLGISFFMIALEEILKDYISISALLGIITLGIILLKTNDKEAKELQKSYNQLWSFFEILLFVLVGVSLNLSYAISNDTLVIIGVILLALLFRSLGVIICILKTKFTKKEKLFIIISYLPKATVQASIGGIALSEGLEVGNLILTSAVLAILITAPLGAVLMDKLHKKLLISNLTIENNNESYIN